MREARNVIHGASRGRDVLCTKESFDLGASNRQRRTEGSGTVSTKADHTFKKETLQSSKKEDEMQWQNICAQGGSWTQYSLHGQDHWLGQRELKVWDARPRQRGEQRREWGRKDGERDTQTCSWTTQRTDKLN